MKKNPSILLSDKHGVNPTIPICFYCGKQRNEVALLGRLKGDVEAPMHACIDMHPCDECLEFMKQGVILISVRNDSDPQNPYRTGGFVVISDEAIKRIFNEGSSEQILQSRFAFVDDETWDKVGIPRGIDETETEGVDD